MSTSHRTHSFSWTTLSLVLVLVAGLCAAQTATTGAVSGTVTDPSGAVVPGLQLVLTNAGTNLALTQTTNPAGQFVFANLAPGPYKLVAKKDGFRTETVAGITVDVDKTTP